MKFKGQVFSLFDFSSTHNQLLFRSSKSDENLDLLFENVFFYSGFLTFENCDLAIASKAELDFFQEKLFNGRLRKDQRVYVIKTGDKTSFIGAGKLSYQRNKLSPSQSSIPIKNENSLNKEDILNLVAFYKANKDFPKEKIESWIEID